ncbi:hypothetical protein HII31_07023 [Pseudocercospora fuligena]|uniref:F-box domain-containing protein n=1 Tax=Pseudocercospora fuligena TaxID=685502 RepID=A0A8H6RFF9_9PEZI|nr:hypothetical protein HII31_07023 [Pseudocercospora fuligena]
MSSAPPEPEQDPCWLLDSLPAELRNEIYELVFESHIQESEISLFDADPPEKALLSTCKQIYSETKVIHRDAHRKYWKLNSFTVRGLCNVEHANIRARDVDQITKLSFTQPEVSYEEEDEVIRVSYDLHGQSWKIRQDGNLNTYRLYVSVLLPRHPRGFHLDYVHEDDQSKMPLRPSAPLHLQLSCLFMKAKKWQVGFTELELPVWGRFTQAYEPPPPPQAPPTPEFIRRALRMT